MDKPGNEMNDLKVAVGVLEKDMLTHTKTTDRLTDTIQKIQEMNANLCGLIKLHDQKHTQSEKIHEAFDEDLKVLDARVDKVILEKAALEQSWHTVLAQSLPSPHNPRYEGSPMKPHLTADERLRKLEEWKWMIVGGAAVGMWLISHVDHAVVLLFQVLFGVGK